ncbi:MAG: hypothetical protein V7609_2104 [Verrucomicrobiota bacterium]
MRRDYQKNRAKRLKQTKQYYAQNKDRMREAHTIYMRVRRHRDAAFAVQLRLRCTFARALRKYEIGRPESITATVCQLLGCSLTEFGHYLESKFLPFMSWENRRHWHIDHERPLASFDLTDPEQQKRAFHYTNLQPLWAIDNLRKGARWP